MLLISRVRKPSQVGSRGVTFTIMPHLAYVDFPTHSTKMLRGIRKYSSVRASANEFGGMMHDDARTSTNERGSKSFGSTITLCTFVNTLNSGATRMS